LTELTQLIVDLNRLSELPPEIGFLSKLENLLVKGNNLITIPKSLCHLDDFNGLNLSTDDGVVCKIVSQKDALISIYSANPGNTLGWGVDNYPEVSFHENGNPKGITMNNKKLTRIPTNIDQLDRLEVLNINNNNLTSLPTALGNIKSLGAITADRNKLSTVPSELGELDNFVLLSITNNPITSIPKAVCDQQISNGGKLTILTDPGEGCD